ncbi:MAG: protein kinase, partial [Acidobacteria bacterium]|nr:protein kinase [Acidobacteriota bacterium]
MTGEAGEMVLHYRLVEKIGEGGMGLVWKAVDTHLDRVVAVKFLPDKFAEQPERMSTFQREARTLAALNHPNIVTIFSVEQDAGRQFFTMEHVPGPTLQEELKKAPFSPARTLEVGLQIADALAAAHGRGITHRDLKPANIVVGSDRVKILDFGLARCSDPLNVAGLSEDTTRSLDPDDRLSGTLRYMAPEQMRSESTDGRSDIFCLGIILYEMATGCYPFKGGTLPDLIAAVLKDTPEPVRRLNPEMSIGFEHLVERCLEKERERRLQSALDLRYALEEHLGDQGKAPAHNSIAVLPFADMSADHDQAYFCEGVAEEIINALTRVRDLRVASRTSSFRFGGASMEPREIGRRLGVDTLLEGSVRKAADQLRVTVQLVDVGNGYQLWSERFDREMRDIFAIQDEIAGNVVRALQVQLSAEEESELRKVPTRDIEAYDGYLKGRQFYYQYRRRGMEYALQLFSQAIERDAEFAMAYAGLADCHSFLYMYGGGDENHRHRALECSSKALELDPRLAEAHASRGLALSLTGQHGPAKSAFETAIRLNPTLYEAYYFYARDTFVQGKLNEALDLYERAWQVRPEDYQVPLLMAQLYEDQDRAADARDTRRRGVALAGDHLKVRPEDTRALYLGANGLVLVGEREKGLRWARRALARDPEEPMLKYNVACTLSMAGE